MDPGSTNESEGVYYKDGGASTTSTGANSPGIRQGRLFFGFCCDMRRAVIVVNLVTISLVVLSDILLLVMPSDPDSDGEFAQVAIKKEVVGMSLTVLLLSAFGIFGALKLEYWIIVLVCFFYGSNAVFYLILLHLPGFVISVLFCCPHFVLAQEISKGIMSEENYPNEKHSCCCV